MTGAALGTVQWPTKVHGGTKTAIAPTWTVFIFAVIIQRLAKEWTGNTGEDNNIR